MARISERLKRLEASTAPADDQGRRALVDRMWHAIKADDDAEWQAATAEYARRFPSPARQWVATAEELIPYIRG